MHKKNSEKEAQKLRNRAEQMAQWLIVPPVIKPLEGNLDSSRLLHELQVYQIELEMQNAELRYAQTESDATLKQLDILNERLEKSVQDSAISKEAAEAVIRAKSDLLARVNGEMRTSLKVIAEMSQQIRRSTLNAEQTECLDKIDTESLNLLNIVKTIHK